MLKKFLVPAIIIYVFIWAQTEGEVKPRRNLLSNEVNEDVKFNVIEIEKLPAKIESKRGIPYYMNYQGFLMDSVGAPVNDTVSMSFSIWNDSSAGNQLWNETQNVIVQDGLFSVILGSTNPIPDSIFKSGLSRWVQLQIEGQILSPRSEITSVGYAYKSIKADSAEYLIGSVTNADMVDSIHASFAPTPYYLYPLDSYGTFKLEKSCNKTLIRVANIGSSNDNKGAIVGATEQYNGIGIEGWGLNSSQGYGVSGGTSQIVKPAGMVGVVGWGQTAGGYFRTDVTGGYGCWGYSNGGAYGLYYTGGIGGTGKNNIIVRTSKGPVSLNVQASPGSWFEDFGSGKLINGKAHIELDPLFLECITISEKYPMKVFIQLTGREGCNGVRVIKRKTGFDVIEFNNGNSNVTFDYRIVAKRKGFENERMEICPSSYNDYYLYPEEIRNVEVKKYSEEN